MITTRKIILTLTCILLLSGAIAQPKPNLGNIKKPNPNAVMDLTSSQQGFLLPRLTKAEIGALQTKLSADATSKGMVIYNIEDSCLQTWKGADWSECNPISLAKFEYDCNNATLAGNYYSGTAVTNDEYWKIPVVVKKAGSYTFLTETSNGVRFFISSIASTLGNDTIYIPAIGTPKNIGAFTYSLQDQGGNVVCTKTMTVTENNAETNLNCGGSRAVGPYTEGLTVDFTDQIVLKVDVVKTGNYAFKTTTQGGMTFSGSGYFNYIGLGQEVILRPGGSDMPVWNAATNGLLNFDILDKNGTSLGCSVPVQVTSVKAGVNVNCATGITVNGQYVINQATSGTSNYINLSVTVTKPGPFTFETEEKNGISFRAGGTFGKLGDTTIQIPASGTPAASGNFTYTLTDKISNTTICDNIAVKVDDAVGLFAPGTCSGGSASGTYMQSVPLSGASYIISMKVLQAGPCTITGTANNITLTSGLLTLTAAEVGTTKLITLTATGRPTDAGSTQIMLTGVNGDLCPINITVADGPGTKTNPGKSCLDILTKTANTAPDGEYWIQPATTVIKTLCDMQGGGYTMVWSYSEETNWNGWAWRPQIECDNSSNLNKDLTRGNSTSDVINYNDYRMRLTEMKAITNGAIPGSYQIRTATNAGAGNMSDTRGKANYVKFTSTAAQDLRYNSSFSLGSMGLANTSNATNTFPATGKIEGVPFTVAGDGTDNGTYNGSATTANGTIRFRFQQDNQFNLIFYNNPYHTKPNTTVRLFGYFDIDNQNGTGTGGCLNDHFGKCGDGGKTCSSGSGTTNSTGNYYIKTGNNYVIQYFIK